MSSDVPTPVRGHVTRVLVVDDQWPVRAAVRAAIEEAPDLAVVGEAADADEALHLYAAVGPDVVLVGRSGPGRGEVETTRRILARHPGVQVMVLTAAVDGDRVLGALDAGAVGYLVADTEPGALRDGVRAVARGQSPLDPRAVRAMLRTRRGVRGEDLTVREREVLALVSRGLANKQIARELCISDGTVKAHIGSIFTRIGVSDRTSAAVWAERNLATAVAPARAPRTHDGGEPKAGAVAGGSMTRRPMTGRPVTGRGAPAQDREPVRSDRGGRLEPVTA